MDEDCSSLSLGIETYSREQTVGVKMLANAQSLGENPLGEAQSQILGEFLCHVRPKPNIGTISACNTRSMKTYGSVPHGLKAAQTTCCDTEKTS